MKKKNKTQETENVNEIKHFFHENNALSRGYSSKIVRTLDRNDYTLKKEPELLVEEVETHEPAKTNIVKCCRASDKVFWMIYILCLSLGTWKLFEHQYHNIGYVIWGSGLLALLGLYIIRIKCTKCPCNLCSRVCPHCKKHIN